MRIYVECAFGEIDRHWGVFWKPLHGALANHQYTIDSALRLHNFIVDFRLREQEENPDIESGRMRTPTGDADILELGGACDDFASRNPFATIGCVTGVEVGGERRRGRPQRIDSELREEGRHVRDYLCGRIHANGLVRPSTRRQTRRDMYNRVIVND